MVSPEESPDEVCHCTGPQPPAADTTGQNARIVFIFYLLKFATDMDTLANIYISILRKYLDDYQGTSHNPSKIKYFRAG